MAMLLESPGGALLTALVVGTMTLATARSAGGTAEGGSVVLSSPGNPLVSFRLVFQVGSADDPSGKEGLAALTAMMLSQGGTRDKTRREVIEALYPMAGEVGAQVDKNVTTLIGLVHRDHLDAFYGIFRESVLEPRWDKEDFERNRDELLLYLTKTLRSADDEELGKHALEWLLYTGHPYRHPVSGTVSGLRSITLEDVQSFYRDRYTIDRLKIGLAGDFPEAFAERVEADLKRALATGPSERAPLPQIQPADGLEILVVEKPTAESSAISIGLPLSVTRADADFYPLLVANTYLGDHRSHVGVLQKKLRAQRGLNYGNYSYVEAFIQDGGSTFPVPNIPRRQQLFSIWLRPVQPANAQFALRGAVRELRLLVENGMSAEAFAATRVYLLSYSKLWVQTLDRRLGYLLDSHIYGTEFYIDEIERRLRNLTVEEVNDAVRRHLDRWDLRVAVVASNAHELAENLRQNRPSPVIYQTPGTPAAIVQEDESIDRYPLPIRDVQIVPASEMFDK